MNHRGHIRSRSQRKRRTVGANGDEKGGRRNALADIPKAMLVNMPPEVRKKLGSIA